MGNPSPFMKTDRTKIVNSIKGEKIMRKNVKTLGALVCAGVLGMGAIGNTAMAASAPGEGDTNVYYTSDSSNIDNDGKILLVIPADVNLNKNKTTGATELKLKTSNGKEFSQFGDNFSATIGVASQNKGNLRNAAGDINAPYKLSNKTDKHDADWADEAHNVNFAEFNAKNSGTMKESVKDLEVSVEEGSVKILEAAPKGTQFTDVLTFKVTELQGNGLTEITK